MLAFGILALLVGITFLVLSFEQIKAQYKEQQKYNKKPLNPSLKKSYEKRKANVAAKIKELSLECIETHKNTLSQKRRQLLTKDEWGRNIDNGWRTNSCRDKHWEGKEVLHIFFHEILCTFLEESQDLGASANDQDVINWSLDNYEDLPRKAEVVQWAFNVFEAYYGIPNFKIWVYDRVDEMCDEITTYTEEEDVDSMEGVVYEDYC